MNGLSGMKWEETDTDISTSDLTQEARSKNYGLSLRDAMLRRQPQKTTGMSVKTDTLYQATIQWMSENADSEDYVITNLGSSICLTNKMTEECLSGSIMRGVSVKASLPDGSLKEEERITFHLQLTTSSKSYNTYAVDIKGNRILLSTSQDLPSGLNIFTVESNLSKMGLCMTLVIQLNCVTYGDAKYWY